MRIIILLIFAVLFSSELNAEETIVVKCDIKKCNKKFPLTATRYYKANPKNNLPALIWLPGGPGIGSSIDYQSITSLENKIDIIIMASPYKIDGKNHRGDVPQAYSKDLTTRTKTIVEFYKKKLNKPIWIGGHSNGGPRVVEFLTADKDNTKTVQGIIMAATHVGPPGDPKIRIKLLKKYNLPTLVIFHERDFCNNTQPSTQKYLFKSLEKRNENITQLIGLSQGVEVKIRSCDSGHHMFASNRDEAADQILKFITKHSK